MRAFLGPVLFILDAAPENQAWGIACCLLLIPSLLIGIVRPRWWSGVISALAAVAWLFLGVIGEGIDC